MGCEGLHLIVPREWRAFSIRTSRQSSERLRSKEFAQRPKCNQLQGISSRIRNFKHGKSTWFKHNAGATVFAFHWTAHDCSRARHAGTGWNWCTGRIGYNRAGSCASLNLWWGTRPSYARLPRTRRGGCTAPRARCSAARSRRRHFAVRIAGGGQPGSIALAPGKPSHESPRLLPILSRERRRAPRCAGAGPEQRQRRPEPGHRRANSGEPPADRWRRRRCVRRSWCDGWLSASPVASGRNGRPACGPRPGACPGLLPRRLSWPVCTAFALFWNAVTGPEKGYPREMFLPLSQK